MDKDIITLDTAILAHEKGFKFNRSGNDISYTRDFEPNDFRYWYNRLSKKYLLVSDYYAETNQNIQQYIHSKDHPVYDAPLQYELQKWLRENYSVQVTPKYNTYNVYEKEYLGYQCEVYDFKNGSKKYKLYKTYEAALEKGLQEALKLIK